MTGVNWFKRDLIGDTSGHEIGMHLGMRSSTTAALRSGPGRVAAVAIVIAAAMSGMMILLLGAPLVFLVLFASAFFDGHTRSAALREARLRPICLPDPASFSDGRARDLIQRLSRSRTRIHSAVRAGPRGAAFDLEAPLEAVPQLEREVVVLASRIEYVARFLESVPPNPTDRTQRRARTVKDLSERAEILAGTAEEILLTLEQTPARITGLQLRRLEACDGRTGREAQATNVLERFDALEQAALDGGLPPERPSDPSTIKDGSR
jgi:hypothetical protein